MDRVYVYGILFGIGLYAFVISILILIMSVFMEIPHLIFLGVWSIFIISVIILFVFTEEKAKRIKRGVNKV